MKKNRAILILLLVGSFSSVHGEGLQEYCEDLTQAIKDNNSSKAHSLITNMAIKGWREQTPHCDPGYHHWRQHQGGSNPFDAVMWHAYGGFVGRGVSDPLHYGPDVRYNAPNKAKAAQFFKLLYGADINSKQGIRIQLEGFRKMGKNYTEKDLENLERKICVEAGRCFDF